MTTELCIDTIRKRTDAEKLERIYQWALSEARIKIEKYASRKAGKGERSHDALVSRGAAGAQIDTLLLIDKVINDIELTTDQEVETVRQTIADEKSLPPRISRR